ncbi:hypothetical protein IJ732_06440 [bacterium]|nr:hypothetical protein [bacterium]
MKKIFLLIVGTFMAIAPVFADVTPYSVNDINPKTIGVYQAGNVIKVYKEPNENSPVLFQTMWNETGLTYSPLNARDVFIAFYPKKNLGFLAVTDESEDMEWVQILYQHDKLGWIKIDDPYKYSNWRNFLNDYGRKYGLMYLKGTPESSKNLYGSPDETSKMIASVTLAKAIKLTSVSGNWLLAIIYDIDHSQKIGWLNWRTKDGYIYLFPSIK